MEWNEHPVNGQLYAISDDQTKTYWINEMSWTYLAVSSYDGLTRLGTFYDVEGAKAEAEEHNKAA